LNDVQNFYNVYTHPPGPPPGNASLQAEALKWINKVFGVTSGYAHELQLASVTLNKGRTLVLQRGGDVRVGTNVDVFYKAIEAKTVSLRESSKVGLVIKTAMNQLCGIGRKGGHVPAAPGGAVRVIDVVVTNELNPFPFDGNTRLPTWTLPDLITNMETKLTRVLGRSKAMSEWLESFMHDVRETMVRPTPNSSRLLGVTSGQPIRHVLTIKISYNPAFDLLYQAAGAQIYVEEVITQVLHTDIDTAVTVTKVKYKDHTRTNTHRRFHNIY
jgi:hypothetical protein